MMIPGWAEPHLGEEEPAEMDPVSGKPVSWGRQIITPMPEEQFAELRGRIEVVCVYPTWYVITKRTQFADLLMAHGAVRGVGIGPGGGFKWVRFSDGTTWGHASFAHKARSELVMHGRLAVKCHADGKEAGIEPRLPRKTIGRAAAGLRGKHQSKRGRR